MRTNNVLYIVAALTATSVLGFGCSTARGPATHVMDRQRAEHEIKCPACYDETVKVFRGVSKVYKSRRKIYTYEKKHMCPDCGVQVTLYTENGTPFIKCARCAPEGVPCKSCRPPPAAAR